MMPTLQDNDIDCPRWSHFEGWCEGFEHDCDIETIGVNEPDCDRGTCDGHHDASDDDGPEPVYWTVSTTIGNDDEVTRGGTAYSDEQAREQVAFWLRERADEVEPTT